MLFDHGGVVVAEALSLIGAHERLMVQSRHRVGKEDLRYRREHYRADA